MADQTGPDAPKNDPLPRNRPNPAEPAAVAAPSGGSRWLPLAAALVVGLILGALGWAVARPSGTSEASPSPAATVTVTSTPAAGSNGDASTISIPASCKEIATDAQKVRDLLTQAVDAAKALDATKMSSVLRQMDAQQQKIADTTKTCTDALPTGVST